MVFIMNVGALYVPTYCFLPSVVMLGNNARLTAPARQVIITRTLPQKLVQRILTAHRYSVSCCVPKSALECATGARLTE